MSTPIQNTFSVDWMTGQHRLRWHNEAGLFNSPAQSKLYQFILLSSLLNTCISRMLLCSPTSLLGSPALLHTSSLPLHKNTTTQYI